MSHDNEKKKKKIKIVTCSSRPFENSFFPNIHVIIQVKRSIDRIISLEEAKPSRVQRSQGACLRGRFMNFRLNDFFFSMTMWTYHFTPLTKIKNFETKKKKKKKFVVLTERKI